jgi:tripartite-type tricarboxylate transporter receptor subunit TctC
MYLIRTFILAIWALTVFPVLAAENIRWPERPIKLIVPYPSGGPTDLLSRAIADRMKDELRRLHDHADDCGGARRESQNQSIFKLHAR